MTSRMPSSLGGDRTRALGLPVLATKLHIPTPRPHTVARPRLIERLEAGSHRRLTLVSAPAGFGKSTLVSTWLREGDRRAAWVSLDSRDNDPARFLVYVLEALRTIVPNLGDDLAAALHSPFPPSIDWALHALLNALAVLPDEVLLVLDDVHLLVTPEVQDVLAFMLEHMPPQVRLVLITREDPALPLPRLRVRDQLTDLTATDLRFTRTEAEAFLTRTMGLALSPEEVDLLEGRTEGWVAALQLAALSIQRRGDALTGTHGFVLDYLVEEVLQRQPERVQEFLLRTAILERFCGSLCEAVTGEGDAQEMLAALERANLFLIPLDDERCWYRYHHLFAELLRQRLSHRSAAKRGESRDLVDAHLRASAWFEANGMDLEAFQHAVSAKDLARAARLAEGNGMPLHFRGAVAPVLTWLATLSPAELDAHPSLWVTYASVSLFVGQLAGVEPKLQAAEAALATREPDARLRDLLGHVASIRATVAVGRQQPDVILAQSRLALEYLHPANLAVRAATSWTLGFAYQLQGDGAAARQAYDEALSISRETGHLMITLTASIGLGHLDEAEGKRDKAMRTYADVLRLAGESPLPVVSEAHLGLARLHLHADDLDAAERHGRLALQLATRLEATDRMQACEDFLTRLQTLREDSSRLPESHRLQAAQPLVEPLSPREREVLTLIASGLSNQEIGERLGLALDTVKGHNRNLFDKLQVRRRTEAIARARELGLL